jgi:hypothetical protein
VFDEECKRQKKIEMKPVKYSVTDLHARRKKLIKKRRKTDKICRRKKRQATNQKLLEMEADFQTNRTREAYKQVIRMTGGFKAQTTLGRYRQGKTLNNSEQVKHRRKVYVHQLLNPTGVEEDHANFPYPYQEDTIAPPTGGEICIAVDKFRNHKAPGVDEIPAELLKQL